MQIIQAEELADRVGEETGVSDWLEIDQSRINLFADATMDHQFIHVDPAAAAQTPFGSTIAHGFLTLSLTTPMMMETMVAPDRMLMAVNYGTDKLRFIEPVKVGSRIRARTRLVDVAEKGPGRWLLKNEVTVEIEGVDRPALIVEALTLFVTA
ncbi:MAG: MaoC family dehydratase [Actinomycetota bacterium]|nr:MaoC family dehydratase [Actinomycetota bacterium]